MWPTSEEASTTAMKTKTVAKRFRFCAQAKKTMFRKRSCPQREREVYGQELTKNRPGKSVKTVFDSGQIQNTQQIKRTLFDWTKQDKTCTFSRKSSFSSYVQHKNWKQTINSTNLVSVGCGRLAEEKGNEDWQSRSLFLSPSSHIQPTQDELN